MQGNVSKIVKNEFYVSLILITDFIALERYYGSLLQNMQPNFKFQNTVLAKSLEAIFLINEVDLIWISDAQRTKFPKVNTLYFTAIKCFQGAKLNNGF